MYFQVLVIPPREFTKTAKHQELTGIEGVHMKALHNIEWSRWPHHFLKHGIACIHGTEL